jgi:hypothetical protein
MCGLRLANTCALLAFHVAISLLGAATVCGVHGFLGVPLYVGSDEIYGVDPKRPTCAGFNFAVLRQGKTAQFLHRVLLQSWNSVVFFPKHFGCEANLVQGSLTPCKMQVHQRIVNGLLRVGFVIRVSATPDAFCATVPTITGSAEYT